MISDKKMIQVREYFSDEPVEMVYLFGSQATDKAYSQSDYDFGVFFKKDTDKKERFAKRLEYIGELGKILEHDEIDVIDLNSAPIQLQYSAILPRKDVVSNNDSQRINFEHRVMSEYFDRLPYIRRHSEISIATIAEKGLQYE